MPRSLKAWREDRYLSMRELAMLAGVSPTAIMKWEHGQARPHPSSIRKLAAALGVDPREIIFGSPDTTSS